MTGRRLSLARKQKRVAASKRMKMDGARKSGGVLLSKAKTRTAVGIHQRDRVGAGNPRSPAGNWRKLMNCSWK